jgi:hypothetical protein
LLIQGECPHGKSCIYSHADIDPEASICPHFSAGFCPQGSACPSKHFTQETAQHFERDPVAYEGILLAARQRATARRTRDQPRPQSGLGGNASQQCALGSAVPALLASLPDPEFPGSNPVVYHIGGLLVLADDDES